MEKDIQIARIKEAIRVLEHGRYGARRLRDAANLLERFCHLSADYKANRIFK